MKYFSSLLMIFFLASCSKDVDLQSDNQAVIETESRSSKDCFDRYFPQLDLFVSIANGVSTGAQTTGNAVVAWDNLVGIIADCNGIKDLASIVDGIQNQADGDCSRIGAMGEPTGGAPCSFAIAVALARADCYLNEWNDNPKDKVAATNFEVAFCDYLLMVNLCLDFGINVDGYCDLINL